MLRIQYFPDMPTYDYICEACGHTFEESQPMSAAPLTDCPNCHKPAVKRMMSSGAVIFKGSGFYQTDYVKSGTPKAGGASESKPSAKPPATPSPSSDSTKSAS